MNLGPHAAFIWASYAIFFVVLSALILWLLWNGAELKKKLSALEGRGVSRRSKMPPLQKPFLQTK